MSGMKFQKINRLTATNKWQMENLSVNNKIGSQELSDKGKKLSFNNEISMSKYQSFMMIEPTVYDSELKNWFLDCIKSIKKEISSRKTGFSSTIT